MPLPPMPVFTLRPTLPFIPPLSKPTQAVDDTTELARVRDSLESAQARLEVQDQELAALRRQLLHATRATDASEDKG